MDGGIDQVDMDAYAALGLWVNETSGTPVAKIRASQINRTATVQLDIPSHAQWKYLVVKEDQIDGQRMWAGK